MLLVMCLGANIMLLSIVVNLMSNAPPSKGGEQGGGFHPKVSEIMAGYGRMGMKND